MKKYFFFIIIIIIIIINILYTYYNNKNYEYYSQIQDAIIFTDNNGTIIGTYPENIYDSETLEQVINRDNRDLLPPLVGVVNEPIFVTIPKGNPGNDGNPGTKGPQGPEGPIGPSGQRAFYNKDKNIYKGNTPESPVYENGEDGKTCFQVNGPENTDPNDEGKCKDGPPGPPGATCYQVMSEMGQLGLLQSGSKTETTCRPEIRQKKCIDTRSGDEKHINCPEGSRGPYNSECRPNGNCTPNPEKCNSKYRRYKEQPNYGNLNNIIISDIKDEDLFDEVTETCTPDNTNNYSKGQNGLTCKQIYDALSNKDLTCGGEEDTEDFCFDYNDHNTKKCYREQGTISPIARNLEQISDNNKGLKILQKTYFNDYININSNKNIIFQKTGESDIKINSNKLNKILQLEGKLNEQCQVCGLGQGNNKTNCNNQLYKGKCTECPKGEYSNNSNCIKCLAGSYTNEMGQSTCKLCPEGTYASDEGNTTCQPCKEGTYASGEGNTTCDPCKEGTYTDEERQSTCKLCPEGTYASDEGNTTCNPCEAGKYASGEGKTTCEQCEEGSYTNEMGQGTCKPCGEGTYASSKGNTKCNPCEAGKYASGEGQTTCQQCEEGSYTDEERQSTCKPCGAGTYASGKGNKECKTCKNCDPGKYTIPGTCTTTKDRECTECPEGHSCNNNEKTLCTNNTYQSNKGQSKCNPCRTQSCNAGYRLTGCTSNSNNECTKCVRAGHWCNGKIEKQCNVLDCAPGQWRQSCTLSNDYTCHNCPGEHWCNNNSKRRCREPCNSNQVEVNSCSPTSDRTCATWSEWITLIGSKYDREKRRKNTWFTTTGGGGTYEYTQIFWENGDLIAARYGNPSIIYARTSEDGWIEFKKGDMYDDDDNVDLEEVGKYKHSSYNTYTESNSGYRHNEWSSFCIDSNRYGGGTPCTHWSADGQSYHLKYRFLNRTIHS